MDYPPGAVSHGTLKASAGPVSIVISTADLRMIVLRNGREIGAAPVLIERPVLGTEAYTLRAVDDSGFHWLRLPLPGQTALVQSETPPPEGNRLRIEEQFRRSVAAILTPGATVVVTNDTLARGETGRKLTVITDGNE